MTDLIFAAILLAILGGAIAYIVKEKKRGVKCIGCPAAGTCSKHTASPGNGLDCSCGCGSRADT